MGKAVEIAPKSTAFPMIVAGSIGFFEAAG
jgi:hypothetical protein